MKRKFIPVVLAPVLCLCVCAHGQLRTDTIDGGGGRATTDHGATLNISIGSIGGLVVDDGPGPCTAKSGFTGQLYDLTALEVAAAPATVNEGNTRQLNARGACDDSTCCALDAAPSWSVIGGPLLSVSPDGLAMADTVYEDTPALAGASYGGVTGSVALLVLNVNVDDFGLYACDGLPDDWQVANFGLNSPDAAPAADPDHDGQNNLYEWTTGTVPTNGASSFTFWIATVPSHADERDLLFDPAFADHAYQVEYRTNLVAGGWEPLNACTEFTNATTRTVRDLMAIYPAAFYRVTITRP